MSAKYRHAPEVEAIANELLTTVDDHLHLYENDVRIVYLFIDKAPQSGGRVILGRARRIGGLNAVLADLDAFTDLELCEEPRPFFVIEISFDIWEGLSIPRRRALVDHELMHCKTGHDDKGNLKLSTRPHDFEEFAAILRRHGLWTAAAERMGAAVVEQLALAIDDTNTFLAGLSNPTPPANVDPDTGEITG